MPLVVDALRRQASHHLRRERRDHTLQPTALVNEAFLRLVKQRDARYENRVHFFTIAAQCMRRVLVDHARSRRAGKRGSGAALVSLTDVLDPAASRDVDILALDDAMKDLATLDPQKSRIVEMRFFAGFSVDEVADALAVSPRTVAREWRLARAWLFDQIGPRPADR